MDPTIISSLPTDSLYKFLALTGVLITVISFLGPAYVRRSVSEALFDVVKRFKIHQAEREILKRETSEFSARLAELKSEYRKDQPNDETADSMGSRLSEIETTVVKLQEKTDELGLIAVELECDTEKVEEYTAQFLSIKRIQMAGIALGLVISVAGFSLWYFKLQVHIDTLTAIKASQTPCEQVPLGHEAAD